MMKKFICLLFLWFMLPINSFAEFKVVDGDSLEIDGRRIRLDGIDAPEYMQTCFKKNGKKYQCGRSALNYVKKQLENKAPDCRCLPQKDRYGREICECFVDDVSLNAAIVSAGWARAYRSDKYAAEEKRAKKQRRGIWQGKHMRPALYRILRRKNEEKSQRNSPPEYF